MDEKMTYLGESKIRVSNPTAKSGAEVSLSGVVLRSLSAEPGVDTIIWYLHGGEVIVRKKAKS